MWYSCASMRDNEDPVLPEADAGEVSKEKMLTQQEEIPKSQSCPKLACAASDITVLPIPSESG